MYENATRKIANKIFIVIFLCVVVALATLGIIGTQTISEHIKNNARESLLWMTRYYAQEFSQDLLLIENKNREVETYIKDTINIAALKTDRNYLAGYEQRLAPYIRNFAEKRTQSVAAWVYFDPVWSDVPHDIYFVDGNGDGIADRQQHIPFSYYSSPPLPNDDKEWWRGPLRTGRGFWTNPYEWTLINQQVIKVASYAAPVYMDDVFIGVAGTYYRFDSLLRKVRDIKVYESGIAMLLNEKLDFIIHPHYFTGTRNNSDNLFTVENGKFEKEAATITSTSYGVLLMESGGVQRLLAYCKLSNGWMLALNPPMDEVYAGLHRLLYTLGFAALLCLALSALAAYAIGRSISRPILRVADAARAMGTGDFTVRAEVSTRDEVETLANSLNSMAQNLHDMTHNLKLSNERLANLIEASEMCVWEYYVPSNTFSHDPQWLRMMQYPGPIAVGTWPLDYLHSRIHPEDMHVVHGFLGKVGRGAFVQFEIRFLSFTDKWLTLRGIARVEECDADGNSLRLAGVGFDITPQKMAAQSEAEQKQRLEALVAQRTRELEESRNQAEAASRAKTAFLSTVSHEIRTPMNAIVGFTHIFDRQNLSHAQTEYLDKIKMSADALLSVINDVLDISKIEAGKMELDNAAFHLHSLLHTVNGIVGFAARGKGLDLHMDVAADVPKMLKGDPKRISQILLNLMNNAVKFTSRGFVRLRVELLQPSDDASVTLGIQVADSGIGLTPEQIARLFQPFSQADNTITRKYGGTGLGLAICKQLVELMGGSIGVASKEGVGSTFHCTLRLCRATAEEAEPRAAGRQCDAHDEEARTRMNGARVLVVEDNVINQEIARALLEEWGLIVDMAENGEVGLSMASARNYHCIFMDMQMPVMDGLETTRLLRARGQSPDGYSLWLTEVPIVAMTANAMAEDRQRCLEAGMNDHLAKPLDPEGLYAILLRWLRKPAQV